jgi:type I restriction-modification system DNA methylase subunit
MSVHRGDAFTAPEFPVDTASVVLMNPPYPHKKTDTPTEAFVERALTGLSQDARLAAIIPLSLLVKSDKAAWRKSILKGNTLEAAIKLPDELFQPYAQPYTVIVFLRKGVPHPKGKRAFSLASRTTASAFGRMSGSRAKVLSFRRCLITFRVAKASRASLAGQSSTRTRASGLARTSPPGK